MSPDIFITGLDAVTPIGTGLDHFWKNLLAGKSEVDVQPLYAADEWPFAIGSAVTDFDPEKYLRPRKSLKFMCRAIQMGCVAAKLAADQAGLGPDSADPNRIATIIGADQFLAEPPNSRTATGVPPVRRSSRRLGQWRRERRDCPGD